MRIKYLIVAAVLGLCMVGNLNAAYPYVELYYYVYDGTDSVERANNALKSVGFKIINGTFQQMDHVGVKGDYTAIVSCLNNENNTNVSVTSKDAKFMFIQKPGQTVNLIIFIVSGPNYKEANRLAMELKGSFENNK